jgi:antitoxin component HigA of HigAB toxin-antitoxin module
MEETKLRKVEESIRVFVRVADPKFRRVVPMRFFNLTLTNAEADAYCAEYLEEKTLRAGVGRILLRSVAVLARMMTELEDLKNHENSGSLWKLHADSLVVLLQIAATLKEHAERVRALAEQHNEPPQVEAIQASMEKLGDRVDLAARILGSAN